MNFLFVIVLACLPCIRGQGFLSKFMNRGRREPDRANEDFVAMCETVRIMPRIAMAVVGGVPLKSENSAPYIAAVGERTSNGSVSWFCGGSIISFHDILTAAHCLVSRNVTTIRVGSFSTKKRSNENDYEVSETIIHPQYKITQSYNDVAVIKTKNKISFSDNVKPVCLPQDDSNTYEKEKARVIGWGAEEFGGEGTNKLQQVEVQIFSNSDCENAYRNSTIAPKTFPKGIQKNQLCAGSPKGGKDACQGDSGGPLVLTDDESNGVLRQIGIVSTGAGCGSKMYPGVYARVSSYTKWIKEQIKKSGSGQSSPQTSDSYRGHNSSKKVNANEESTTHRGTTVKTPSQSVIRNPQDNKNTNTNQYTSSNKNNFAQQNSREHSPEQNNRRNENSKNKSDQNGQLSRNSNIEEIMNSNYGSGKHSQEKGSVRPPNQYHSQNPSQALGTTYSLEPSLQNERHTHSRTQRRHE